MDDADHAGPADARHHLVAAEGLELVGDDAGGAVHVVHELGMLVQVAAPRRDLIGKSATRLMIGMVGLRVRVRPVVLGSGLRRNDERGEGHLT